MDLRRQARNRMFAIVYGTDRPLFATVAALHSFVLHCPTAMSDSIAEFVASELGSPRGPRYVLGF